MVKLSARRIAVYAAAMVLVGVTAGLLRRIPFLVPSAATPLLVLEVLLIARAWGTGPALAGSTAAGAAFAYYFLPSQRFDDLNDLVALFAFTGTAFIVGELSARAERRQLEAEGGRHEIEQLYQQLGAAFERASDAEAARRNEQLKAALLDALTHNLRTPLTSIKAAVTALLGVPDTQLAAGLTREGRRELLQVIDEESDRLNRFIEGLSATDRRADAAESASLRIAALPSIVDDAVTRAATILRRHVVRTMLDPAVPTLSVDPGAIAEALYMLLDNASKYAPIGSTITIETSRVDAHHARLTVTDCGPGIPAQFRDRVFEKFFRIPGRDAVDPRRAGVGLGLPIARRLVESQAGSIVIDAPPDGAGTRIVLTLPVSDALAKVDEPLPAVLKAG